MKEMIKKSLPCGLLDGYYLAMEFFAAFIYGFPGRKLNVIGITGTKGKSTTTFLVNRILEEAGFRVGSISSIEFRLDKKSEQNELKMTLPSRWMLQRFLRSALDKKVDYVVLECTSQGLAQHRVDFVHFIAAVFTNLAPEHIESHSSYENYKKAKRRLFELLNRKGIAVFNGDDKEAGYFAKAFRGRHAFYSLKNSNTHFNLSLIGEFNQYNALAAHTLCLKLGVSHSVTKKALEKVAYIPGRLEEITEGQNFRVFVDYAHNPSSLEAVLSTLAKLLTSEASVLRRQGAKSQKLIAITGSQGGGRDKWKRPEMGRIGAKYADVVIITNEDPYQEDPERIIDDVYQGVRVQGLGDRKVLKILDRKEAVKKALQMAKKGDIVLIAGKGSETVMETREGKIEWNEREIVRVSLRKILGITNNQETITKQ